MSAIFRRMTEEDLPAVAALWQEAFGDPPSAVSDFFAAFPQCCSYVAQVQGQVVSMAHALPQKLSTGAPAAYFYAVATAKHCRGNGLCRRLLAAAEAALREAGVVWAVLTPGEPELFDFYEKLGYETMFYRKRTQFSGGEPISMEAYLTLRESILQLPHMVYEEQTLDYARKIYGLQFYRTAEGCAAAGADYTAEVLPGDCGGAPFAMGKLLGVADRLPPGYLGFALE